MSTIARLVVQITSNTAGLVRGLSQSSAAVSSTQKKVMSAGRAMVGVGTGLTKYVTLPIVGIGAAAVKTGLDFDKAMTDIDAMVGASDKQMKMYESTVMSMSRTLPVAPQELAEALYFVTSSGFKGASALKVLKSSAMASAAGMGETKTVADAVTSAVNAYGESALSARDSTDILFAAVREGKAEPEELAGVIGRVIPMAQEMGIEFHEVASAVAGLTLTGLDASEAVTAVRGSMAQLLKPTKEATEGLKEMGHTVPEIRTAMEKDFFGTLVMLRKDMKKHGVVPTEVFGNIRAAAGFLALTGRNAAKNKAIFKELAGTSGDTSEAVKEASKSTQYKWRQMMTSIRTSILEVWNVIEPVFNDVVKLITKGADAFGKLSPEAKKMVVIGLAIAAAIGPVLVILGGLVIVIGALMSPITLVVLAIVAFIAVIVMLAIKFKWFRDLVGAIFKAVLAFIKNPLAAIQNLANAFVNWFKSKWSGLWNSVKSNVARSWSAIKSAFSSAWNAIEGVVKTGLRVILAIMTGGLSELVMYVIRNWDKIVQAVRNAGGNVIDFVKSLPGKILSALGNLGSLLLSAGRDLIMGLVNGIKNMAGAAADAAKSVVKGAISGAKGLLGIRSPSKVFQEMGRNTIAGLNRGLMKDKVFTPKVGLGIPAAGVSPAATAPGVGGFGGKRGRLHLDLENGAAVIDFIDDEAHRVYMSNRDQERRRPGARG